MPMGNLDTLVPVYFRLSPLQKNEGEIVSVSISRHWIQRFYLSSIATSRAGQTVYATKIKPAYVRIYEYDKEKVRTVANLSHLYSLPRADGNFLADRPNDGGGRIVSTRLFNESTAKPVDSGIDDRMIRNR